jgi:hypothetical protein
VHDPLDLEVKRGLGMLFEPSDYPTKLYSTFDLEAFNPALAVPHYPNALNPSFLEVHQSRVRDRFASDVEMPDQATATRFRRPSNSSTANPRSSGTPS